MHFNLIETGNSQKIMKGIFDNMPYDKNVIKFHPKFSMIRERIVSKIDQARRKGMTYEEIAEKCHCATNHIWDLHKRKKGANISLNMAIKVWEGLGGALSELFSQIGPDSIWEKIADMDRKKLDIIIKLHDLMVNPIPAPGLISLENLINEIYESQREDKKIPHKIANSQ